MRTRLTVVMPVYNSRKYLSAAIESILHQSYRDFIFFIIDDGSTDGSADIIKEYAATDSRIQYFQQANRGLIATLNLYFKKVETPLIARMDSDDVVRLDRFEKQIKFLDENPEVGVVGTALRYMDESLSETVYDAFFPVSHSLIVWKMLATTGIAHATVIMQKKVFELAGDYSEAARYIEDYDFFMRVKEVTRIANLHDILYFYRKHDESVSHKFREEQLNNHFELSKAYIRSIQPEGFTEDAVHFLKYNTLTHAATTGSTWSYLVRLHNAFVKKVKPSVAEEKDIADDLNRQLSVLSLSVRHHYFWKGSWLYFRTFIRAPWIVVYNWRNKKK